MIWGQFIGHLAGLRVHRKRAIDENAFVIHQVRSLASFSAILFIASNTAWK